MNNLKYLMIAFLFISSTAAASEVDILMARALPPLPDNHEVQMLTVEFEPGESSEPHRHYAHIFVYVLEGRVRMQVEGGEPVTLSPGQTFYESPEDVHTVSQNASTSEPAKFLVFSIKEKGAPATVPAGERPEGK